MSDGDNVQWLFNAFPTGASWWGSPARGAVPLGWTLSPGLVALGPVVLHYLARTRTRNDDLVAAPSGIGYAYPSEWAAAPQRDFAALTGEALTRTSAALGGAAPGGMRVVNVIGDPCVGGSYVPGCTGLWAPNMTALAPLLARPEVDGVFFYTYGAGYSGWSGTRWSAPVGGGAGKARRRKPVVGGRVSLWGEAASGTMLGVRPLVARLRALLAAGKISTDAGDADGYSLVPVHAWSHNVSDVALAARLLAATGDFEVVTPTALMQSVAANVAPS